MITCAQCGQKNEDTLSFCRYCGNRLTPPQQQQPGYGANSGAAWAGPPTTEDDNAPVWLRALRDQQRGEMYGVPQQQPNYASQQQPNYASPQQPNYAPQQSSYAPPPQAMPPQQPGNWAMPAAPSAYGEAPAWDMPSASPWTPPGAGNAPGNGYDAGSPWAPAGNAAGGSAVWQPSPAPQTTPAANWGAGPTAPDQGATFSRSTVFNDNSLPDWLRQGQAQMAAELQQAPGYPAQPAPGFESGTGFGAPTGTNSWGAAPQMSAYDANAWGQPPTASPFGASVGGPQEMRARELVEDDALPPWLRVQPDIPATPPAAEYGASMGTNSAWPAFGAPAQPEPWMTQAAPNQGMPASPTWGAMPPPVAAMQPDPFQTGNAAQNALSAADLVDEASLPDWLRTIREPAAPQQPQMDWGMTPQQGTGYGAPAGTNSAWPAYGAPASQPAPGVWDSRQPTGQQDLSQIDTGRWPSSGTPGAGNPAQAASPQGQFSMSDLIDPGVLDHLQNITPPPQQPQQSWGQAPGIQWLGDASRTVRSIRWRSHATKPA